MEETGQMPENGLKTGGSDKMEAYKKEFIDFIYIFHF